MFGCRATSVFLSHNSNDKEDVRRLAASIAVTGAHVWFDEWSIRPGDSIPGEIDKGLAKFTIFALVWSSAAAASDWVRVEMDAAVTRWIRDRSLRLTPVVLDDTPLPAILAALKYVDARDGKWLRVSCELLGIDSDTSFRMAVQAFVDEAGLDFREFEGVGVLVACPRCGASAKHIEGWHEIDHKNDRSYVGAKCTKCGWNDGSET